MPLRKIRKSLGIENCKTQIHNCRQISMLNLSQPSVCSTRKENNRMEEHLENTRNTSGWISKKRHGNPWKNGKVSLNLHNSVPETNWSYQAIWWKSRMLESPMRLQCMSQAWKTERIIQGTLYLLHGTSDLCHIFQICILRWTLSYFSFLFFSFN